LAVNDAGWLLVDRNQQRELTIDLIAQAIKIDLEDYFNFDLKFEKELSGLGGQRYMLAAKLDGVRLSIIQLDITIEGKNILPREAVRGHNILDFAGIRRPLFKAVAKEEVFADKIHAYTRTRESQNTRVKDLSDLCKLIDEKLNKNKAKLALERVFADKRLRALPSKLPAPPEDWTKEFDTLAKRTRQSLTLEQAYNKISQYYSALRMQICK
jgi:predicted nucleotidyltransferase component of viral defense system